MTVDLYERQRDEIRTLKERVRQLEDALAPSSVNVPIEWFLTTSEARVYACLASREMATKEMIMMALYSDRLEEPEPKIVDVFICKLRKKLGRHGISIETVWGRGYALRQSAKVAA